jgi:flagellar biosynthesis protein FlhF
LVLSCAAHPDQMLAVAREFGFLGLDRVVFTKVDEAVGLGVILNVIRRLNLQLSYLTTGQEVPDDLEVGHRRRIAELILGRAGAGAVHGRASVNHVA